MTKMEEAIDKIAEELCLYCQKNQEYGTCTVEQPCDASKVTATTILDLTDSEGNKRLGVIAKDQPEELYPKPKTLAQNNANYGWRMAKEAGFVKLIPAKG